VEQCTNRNVKIKTVSAELLALMIYPQDNGPGSCSKSCPPVRRHGLVRLIGCSFIQGCLWWW